MSDNIPTEILVEILKKLPLKPLIQFRSVSKTWKSLIDNPHFISRYCGQSTHLLVSHELCSIPQFYTFPDDDNDTLSQKKVYLTSPKLIKYCNTIGCSHGLLCLSRNFYYYESKIPGEYMAYLWNPSVRKLVAVVVPNVGHGVYTTVLGFGVCRETIDPKIVKINFMYKESDVGTITSIPWQVEIFPLSVGAWRSSSNNLPSKSIAFTNVNVSLDGFSYWLASDRNATDRDNMTCHLIISLDMTSEEFGEIRLPDRLAHKARCNLYVCELRESLAVVEQRIEDNNLVFVVWKMEDRVSKSFTKLFSANVNTPHDASVLGFRNNGEPIIEIMDDSDGQLVVYEPYSKSINNLGVDDGMGCSFSVWSYKETLLLLDQPNLTVYSGNKTLRFENDLLTRFKELKQLLRFGVLKQKNCF